MTSDLTGRTRVLSLLSCDSHPKFNAAKEEIKTREKKTNFQIDHAPSSRAAGVAAQLTDFAVHQTRQQLREKKKINRSMKSIELNYDSSHCSLPQRFDLLSP